MTPFRTALAQAVVDRLAAAVPDLRPTRARRAEVAEAERPLLLVSTGDAEANSGFSDGETLWTVQVLVAVHLAAGAGAGGAAAAAADRAAEDAAAEAERRVIAALNGQALPRPGGGDLTCGVWVAASSLDVLPAERAARRLIDLSITFTARLLLPAGNPAV